MSSFTDLTATNLKSSGFNPNPMPAPTNAPFQWPFPTNVTEPIGVMEFNGGHSFVPERHIYSNDYLPNFTNFHKRRSSSPPLPILPPAKQLITEEKIAAHFNSMSLSSDGQLFAYNEIDDMDDAPSSSSGHFASTAELEEKLKRAQRIIVCEKVRSQLKEASSEPIIPKVLLDMERSKCPSTSGGCKALILWEPPANKSPLSSFITRKTDENNEDAEEMDNNNSSNFENNNNANVANNNNNNNNLMEDVAMDDL